MKIEELVEKIQEWQKTLVDRTVKNEDNGRQWITKAIGYTTTLSFKDMKTFFDRKEQNDEYVKRYKLTDPNTKGPYVHIQAEIDMLYSFHKCFALRHKHRLAVYRDDLSQKGVHTYSAISRGIAQFKARRDIAEKGNAQ